ncbi:hypothetical protein CCP3SC5AM1_1760002 [Gammaproteobacteria bacterium]
MLLEVIAGVVLVLLLYLALKYMIRAQVSGRLLVLWV